jgi:hypothetical protein
LPRLDVEADGDAFQLGLRRGVAVQDQRVVTGDDMRGSAREALDAVASALIALS